MYIIKSNLIGLITLILILVELIIGFGTLAIVNIPRALFPTQGFKIYLSKLSNRIGEITVYGLKVIMIFMHGNTIQIIDDAGIFHSTRPNPQNMNTKNMYLQAISASSLCLPYAPLLSLSHMFWNSVKD